MSIAMKKNIDSARDAINREVGSNVHALMVKQGVKGKEIAALLDIEPQRVIIYLTNHGAGFIMVFMSTEAPTLNLMTIAKHFSCEADAYKLVESIRWPNGPICPHCGTVGEATYLEPRGEGRKTRSGKISERRVWKCKVKGCRKQFSVTVGTIFERSHVSLDKWLLAVYLMCSNKNGVAAFELHREMSVTYQTAWFMCHRIREAMKREPLASKFAGIVEADETYIGGKPSNKHQQGKPREGRSQILSETTPDHVWPTWNNKTPVFTLIDRETGEARSQVMPRVTGDNVERAILDSVNPNTAVLMTDQAQFYRRVGRQLPSHHTINHNAGEYVRGHAHTNTAEGFFSQLKRSIDGTYHHVGVGHLQRYLVEFDYRYSTRKLSDGERTRRLIAQTAGKRLTYRKPLGRD